METRKLGLVKSVFKQSNTPIRTDVLWVDTSDSSILKIYDNVTLKWVPLKLSQLSGSLTDGAPTISEIESVIKLTAIEAGAGYRFTIKDTDGTELLYQIESDGVSWFYIVMTKAL